MLTFTQPQFTKSIMLSSMVALGSMTVLGSLTAQAKDLSVETFVASPNGFYVTSTLVKGEQEMILIDSQFLLSDAHRLVAEMLETGLKLKAVLVTHAHPDHYFGVQAVLEAFPDTPVYAADEVVAEMQTLGPKKFAQWKPVFKANLTDALPTVTALQGDTYKLEGQDIRVMHIGQGDMAHSTMFYIPSANAIVAGDLTYENIHPWTAETDLQGKKAWQSSLQKLQSFAEQNGVTRLISGHTLSTESGDVQEVLSFNQQYLSDFVIEQQQANNATDLQTAMEQRYPGLQLPIILKLGAEAAYR